MGSGSSLIFLCPFAKGYVTGAAMLHILNVALVTGVDGLTVLDASSVKT